MEAVAAYIEAASGSFYFTRDLAGQAQAEKTAHKVLAIEIGATKPPESPRLLLKGFWCLCTGAEMIEPKPAVRRWTTVEDNLLHDMLNAGLTAKEISKRLARTPTAIYSRVQDLDKKRRKRSGS